MLITNLNLSATGFNLPLKQQPSSYNDYILVNLEGFEDFNNVQLNTEQKGYGAGSYVISRQIGEREVMVEFYMSQTSTVNLDQWLIQLQDLLYTGNPIQADRVWLDGSTEKRKERLTGGSLVSLGWERMNDDVTGNLTIMFTNPLKTIFLNGSATASGTSL